MNRGGSVFDRRLAPIPADQQTVLAHTDSGVTLHRQGQRIPRGLTTVRVDDLQHFRQRPAGRLCSGPSGHALGDRVHIRDVARQVGAENGIPDGVKHHLRTLPGHAQYFGRSAGTIAVRLVS